MPERSSVSQLVQIGLEATPGVLVAATKRLSALSIEPSINAETDRFRPMGYKFDTLTALNREWTEGDISGQPTYSEIIYPLASLIGAPITAQVMDGAVPTGAYKHTFSPASTSEDTPKTFTVEQGSAFRAHRFGYGLITELGMTFGRDSLSMDGSIMGTRLEDGITLTPSGSVTAVELVPILPSQVDVYWDATEGALGTTKLGRLLSCELSIGDRYNPLWVLDSSKTSWVAHVETPVDATLTMTMEADAQGMGLLPTLRAGDTRFARIKARGPNIFTGGVTVDYLFQADMAAKITEVGDFSDEDGVYAIEWTTRLVHDADYGKALTIDVINKQATL